MPDSPVAGALRKLNCLDAGVEQAKILDERVEQTAIVLCPGHRRQRTCLRQANDRQLSWHTGIACSGVTSSFGAKRIPRRMTNAVEERNSACAWL